MNFVRKRIHGFFGVFSLGLAQNFKQNQKEAGRNPFVPGRQRDGGFGSKYKIVAHLESTRGSLVSTVGG